MQNGFSRFLSPDQSVAVTPVVAMASGTRRIALAATAFAALCLVAAAPTPALVRHPSPTKPLPRVPSLWIGTIERYWTTDTQPATTFTFIYNVAWGPLAKLVHTMSGPPPKLNQRIVFPSSDTAGTCEPLVVNVNVTNDCIALATAVKALWEVGYVNVVAGSTPMPTAPAVAAPSDDGHGLPKETDANGGSVTITYTIPNSLLKFGIDAGTVDQTEVDHLAAANPANTITFAFPTGGVTGTNQNVAMAAAVKAIWEGRFYHKYP